MKWPWKWSRSGQNLITSFPCPNNVLVLVWSYSSHWFKIQCAHKLFPTKFEFQFLTENGCDKLKSNFRSHKCGGFSQRKIKVWSAFLVHIQANLSNPTISLTEETHRIRQVVRTDRLEKYMKLNIWIFSHIGLKRGRMTAATVYNPVF